MFFSLVPITVTEDNFVIVFQSLSCVQFFETPWTEAHQAPLTSTISMTEALQVFKNAWIIG